MENQNENKEKFYGNLISFIFIITLLTITVYFLNKSPCDTPLTYSIGRVDPQFGISKESVKKYAEVASDLWNREMNKYLLKEATSSDVVINFVFDERQRATIQAERLKAEIDSQKNNLNDLKTKITLGNRLCEMLNRKKFNFKTIINIFFDFRVE